MRRKNSDIPRIPNTGYGPLDEEHRVLFEELDVMSNHVIAGSSCEEFLQSVASFIEKMKAHFNHEEEMLADNNDPTLDDHKKAHEELLDHLRVFVEQIRVEEKITVDAATVKMIKQWFTTHVNNEDQVFATYKNPQD